MLDIRLLGPPRVTMHGRPVEVDTRKAIALLAYLTIEGSAERDSLATLFWADSPPERARATLRRTLSSLRGAIGEGMLDTDRDQIGLVGEFVSDVARFTGAIDSTGGHGHDPNDVCGRCIEPLVEAASLYRGDFLSAFHIRDAPDFEDWSRSLTESLRLKAGQMYQRLALAHASVGDYVAAIDAAAAWVGLDELHEPAHRLRMLLNAWAGDRSGAINAYRSCVGVLDRELGVPPLEETSELYEAILDEDLPPAPAVRRSVRTVKSEGVSSVSGMIDRRAEIDELTRSLGTARTTGRLCVITGDSWMGKTRLIEEITAKARGLGFVVASGRAFRAETELPYGVATQLLEPLIEELGADRSDVGSWVLEELARLDPKLARGVTIAESERFGKLRLREAFLEVVRKAGSRQPLLVSVDDVQWIDAASAALVSFVLRGLGETPSLILLAVRDLQDLPAPLREVADEAGTVMHLEPLGVEDLVPADPVFDVTELISATGGVPLLVQEAIESGSMRPDSASVVRYIEGRRQRLGDLSRQVLAAAAVLSGMCDAQLLRDTSGRTDEETVDAVEELISAGVIREEPDGTLAFTLDVMQALTYESTSLIRRRLLHRRAADALASSPRSHTDARLASATARHLGASGSEEAADWFRRAGDLSRAIFANDEAVSAYETAIALGHPRVGQIRLALGELALARGDYEAAKQELQSAAAQTEGVDLAVVEHRMGNLHRILGRFELAEESFSRALADHPDAADLYADWALLEHRVGRGESAVEYAARAVESAGDAGDAEMLARALNILGVVTSDFEESLTNIDRALGLAASEPARMAALNSKAHLLAESGDPESGIPLVEEAISLADRAGYRHHQAALLNHLADLHHQSGREEEAQRSLTAAVTLFAGVSAGDWEPEVWLLREW